MASERSRALQRYLAPLMKQAGFRKNGATWWKAYPDSVGVLNIQGSQWGPELYINLGISFRACGHVERPRIAQCHIHTRLSAIVGDAGRVERLQMYFILNGEDIPIEVRHRELARAVREHGLPWLERYSSVDGARADVARGGHRCVVAPPLRGILLGRVRSSQ